MITKAVGLETLSPAMARISNYFDWIYDAMLPYLGARVLEVGPGFGNLGERILRSGRTYYAVDSDLTVIETLHKKLGLTNGHVIAGDIASAAVAATVSAWKPDTLISMNVLEHQENDHDHLVSLMRFPTIRRLILFVPASPMLYGTMDRQAGHFRRYSRRALMRLLTHAGAKNIYIRYFNGLGAPAWWVAGRLFHCQTDSEATNKSIASYDRYIVPAARFMDPFLSRFFGQSLLAFAENGTFISNRENME